MGWTVSVFPKIPDLIPTQHSQSVLAEKWAEAAAAPAIAT